MAEVGKVLHISAGKVATRFNGSEDWTISLAISAGIANGQLTISFPE
jgi:hypothetical protein